MKSPRPLRNGQFAALIALFLAFGLGSGVGVGRLIGGRATPAKETPSPPVAVSAPNIEIGRPLKDHLEVTAQALSPQQRKIEILAILRAIPIYSGAADKFLGDAMNVLPLAMLIQPGEFEELLTLPDQIEDLRVRQQAREVLERLCFDRWADLDPNGMEAWLREQAPKNIGHDSFPPLENDWPSNLSLARERLVEAMADKDAFQAWSWFENFNRDLSLPMKLRALPDLVLARAIEQDPHRAEERIAGIANREKRREALRQLVTHLKKSDMSLALALLDRWPEKGMAHNLKQRETQEQKVSTGVEPTQEERIAEALAVKDPVQRTEELEEALYQDFKFDPQRFVLKMMELQQDETRFPGSAIYDWSELDPVEALSFVITIQDCEWKRNVIDNSVEEWTSYDGNSVATWIDTLEQGSARDVALTAYAKQKGLKDPALAADWTMKISDPEMRQTETVEQLRNLKESDEAAFQQWIRTHSPDDELLDKLKPKSFFAE